MIYFDNAATTYPKPEGVLSAVKHAVERCGGNPGRGSHALALAAAELVYDARCGVAELLRVREPEHIIFTPNATFSLNLAILTRVHEGSHLLVSDQEHNASLRPILRLAGEGRISYSIFSAKAPLLRQEVERHLRPESDILVCNLVSNVTGHTVDVGELIRFAKEHGLYLILDASQWLGHTEVPFPLDAVDAFCAPGHKGLYGIQGCGLLYLKSAEGLPAFISGGSGSESKKPEMPKSLPERYEAGTLATPAIASLLAGIRFLRQIGPSAIEEKESALTGECVERLASFPDVCVWARSDMGGSVLSFSHKHLHPDRIAEELGNRGICVRSGYHCAPLAHASAGTDPRGTVRISFGIFNTRRELDVFYQAMKEILKG